MYFKSRSHTIVKIKIAKDAEINDFIHNIFFGYKTGLLYLFIKRIKFIAITP